MRTLRRGVMLALSLAVLLVLLAVPVQAGTWTAVEAGDNINYYSVHPADASHVWAGGVTFIPPGSVGFEDSGIIGRSTDSGATWQYSTSHQAGDVSFGWNFRTATAVDFVDATRGWAVLSDGTIVATTDGGATWKVQAEGSFEFRDNNWGYSSIDMVDAARGVAVGGWVGFIGVSKARIAYTANGQDWIEAGVPDLEHASLEAICMVDASYGWAAGSIGATDKTPLILMTSDGGATWTRQAAGPPAGAALHGVWFTDRNHGWVVGDKGGIYVTADGGATWWSQASPTTETLLAVTFAGPATGWAVGENGTILETSKAGLPWAVQSAGVETTLRDVAVAAGVVWAAGDEGTLLTSTAPAGGVPGYSFSDVASSPYKAAIESLAIAGIVNGFPDGTFRPEAGVLRAQCAKMLLGTLGIAPGFSTSTRFTDLGAPDANGYPHRWVQEAFAQGITNGANAAQTLFAPWNTIRRDQAVSMIVRGTRLVTPGLIKTPPAGTPSLFAAVGPPHGDNLRIAEYIGLLDGLAGMGAGWDIYAPATRGEIAQMLHDIRPAQVGD